MAVWIALAAAGVAIVGFGLKRLLASPRDLDKGAVSQSWVVEHRADRDSWK
jgi:hypothetical protein